MTSRRFARGIDVTTHGLGNNVQPGMNVVNELVGPEVFNELDRQMRANIERHHGKGFWIWQGFAWTAVAVLAFVMLAWESGRMKSPSPPE